MRASAQGISEYFNQLTVNTLCRGGRGNMTFFSSQKVRCSYVWRGYDAQKVGWSGAVLKAAFTLLEDTL